MPDARGELLLAASRAYDRLQQIYYYRGEYLPLFLANLTTLNLAERAMPSAHLAVAYANAGATAGIIPLRATAARYFALAHGMLAEAYDEEAESYLCLLHSVYLTGLGRWEDAVATSERAIALAAKLGFRRRWEEAAGVRCRATCDLDERLEWADRALASSRGRADPQMMCWGFNTRAEVLADRGRFASAAEDLAHVDAIMPRLGAPEQTWALATKSMVSLAQGSGAEATAIADRAAALVKQTKPIHFGGIDAYARIAHVQLAAWIAAAPGDRASRGVKARAACADLQAAARIFPIAEPSYRLQEGTRRWVLGQPRNAHAMWQRGLAAARRLRLPYREAQLLSTMRRHLPSDAHPERASARGDELATQLGLSPEAILVVDGTLGQRGAGTGIAGGNGRGTPTL
jgi:tetratricopeptide (TPR) repeat protein